MGAYRFSDVQQMLGCFVNDKQRFAEALAASSCNACYDTMMGKFRCGSFRVVLEKIRQSSAGNKSLSDCIGKMADAKLSDLRRNMFFASDYTQRRALRYSTFE